MRQLVWQQGDWAYQVHGSIGILLRAIRRQQRTSEEVLSLLQGLPSRSILHVRPGLLHEIIARVESETGEE
jgi:dTDP-4-dehydrorhamnose 3,5-epimerase-like enzyme